MLALAIIATVILSIIILAFFGAIITYDDDGAILGFALMILLSFVIVTIWILYAR